MPIGFSAGYRRQGFPSALGDLAEALQGGFLRTAYTGREAFQISLEIFDENRDTTVCTYRSREGDSKVTEHEGRYFCPRVITETTESDDPAAQLLNDVTLVADNRPRGELDR